MSIKSVEIDGTEYRVRYLVSHEDGPRYVLDVPDGSKVTPFGEFGDEFPVNVVFAKEEI